MVNPNRRGFVTSKSRVVKHNKSQDLSWGSTNQLKLPTCAGRFLIRGLFCPCVQTSFNGISDCIQCKQRFFDEVFSFVILKVKFNTCVFKNLLRLIGWKTGSKIWLHPFFSNKQGIENLSVSCFCIIPKIGLSLSSR